MSNKLKKWSKSLNVIGCQIQNMLIKQDTHHTLLRIIAENKSLHEHNPFYDHLFHTYISYISVSLRRQLKRDKNSISLYGVLSDIADNMSDIPLHKHIELDPESDIARLKEASSVIEKYVDRRIAHTDKRSLDKRSLDKLPNPSEVENCIEIMKEIHKRYNSVVNKVDVELMPVRYDWTHIFEIPWVQVK